MNKLASVFNSGRKQLLNIYFTAGYPQLEDTEQIIQCLAENGVDMVEIGMPYSDPMADGPTIQQSSKEALENGLTLELLFKQVASARKSTQIPFILMGYLNQMIQYGESAFLDACVQSGIECLIIPDLPPELYASDYQTLFEEKGVSVVFLVTPQTSESRIRYIDGLSQSFIYVVSDSSITGSSKDLSEGQIAYFQRIQSMNLKNPCMIGFGISDKQSFDQATQYASGAIIGSAFIKALDRHRDQELSKTIGQFIQSIKS